MIRTKIKEKLADNGVEILLSILIITGIYLIAALKMQIQYASMDDWRIEGVLSRAFTGKPFYSHSYVNAILGYFLSSIYKVAPGINWWFLYNHFIIILGMFFMHYSFLKMAKKRAVPRYLITFLLFALDFVLLLRWIIGMAYTTAPIIFAVGSIAYAVYLSETECRGKMIKILVIAFVTNTLATMERNQSGMSLLPFWLLTILYILLKNNLLTRQAILRYGILALLLCFLQFGMDFLNQAIRLQINETKWWELFQARVSIGDYPHDEYWENPDLYQEAGISENEAALYKRGIFFEDVTDASSILYVCDNSRNNDRLSVENLRNTAADLLITNMRNVLFMGILSFCLAILPLFKSKNRYSNFVFWANNIGGGLLLLYVMLRGRFYIRVAFVVAFPMIILNLVFFMENITKEQFRELIIGMVIPFSLVIGINEWLYLRNENEAAYNVIENTDKIENYVDENPDGIFFYTGNTYQKINPFRSNYANILKLATGDVYSKSWRLQMKQNGINAYTGDVFDREDVVVLSTDNMETYVNTEMDIFCLYNYLKEEKGCLGFVIYDEIPDTNVFVYKFIFETNVSEYEKYISF